MFIQTPPYGFFPSIGIKALPKSKSKEQYFIPQKTKERQWIIKTVSSEEHPLTSFPSSGGVYPPLAGSGQKTVKREVHGVRRTKKNY
jgi:hypothetical protein